MEFRLLGPLEVVRDGHPLTLGGPKQRALLALLLLRANRLIPRDVLLDELWGDRPSTAAHSLDVQVSRLRKALEPDEPLLTRAGGYLFEVDPERIDVARFERLLGEGRGANAAGDAARAADLLRQALSLWRGDALADLAYEPFARLEIARLQELRLVAVEERVEAELALGLHAAVIPELDALVATEPLRERPIGQLMVTLYRSGRQAEALGVYAATRRRFVDELGLEPGPALRALEQAILRQDDTLNAPSATAPTTQRHRRLVAAIALPAVAGAATAGLLLVHSGTRAAPLVGAPLQGDSVALVSERTGKVVAHASTAAPVFSRFGAGALWNVSFTGVLSKLDPRTGATLRSVNAVPTPCGLEIAFGAVWITDCTSPTLVRIDPTQVVVTRRIPLPAGAWYDAGATGGVATGAGSVWVAQGTTNPSHVYRVDPVTEDVQARIEIPEGGAGAIAFGNGAVWVGGGTLGRLSRIDPRTNGVSRPARDLGPWLCCVAAGGGYVWAAGGHQVWKLSRSGQILDVTKLAGNLETVRYADGAVWASDGDAGSVARIDAATDVPMTFLVGHNAFDMDARNGIVAVSVQRTGHDVMNGVRGRIAVVALKDDTLDSNTSTDPVGVQSFNADQIQFHYATCAKLFNYPDRSGAAGTKLQPEVAADWPKVTDGGRTFTFTIRRGYGFSPPSHEQVDAESFRHEIERVLKQPGPASLERLSDVVGADAYRSGRARHLAGVQARGATLVIRLRHPSGDLPTRLAASAFCAVPAQLETVPFGLPYPIPTAGPYYLADRSRDVFVLKPNPNYHGTRPRALDAIVYRVGVDIATATLRIQQRTVDYVQAADAALAPGTAAAHATGYRLVADNSTVRLALNTERPSFADVRTRRAVAYAIDRRALTRTLTRGEFMLPTSRLLPPSLGRRGDSFPLTARLDIARTLAGGRHLHVVYAALSDAAGNVYNPHAVEALQMQLGRIGVTVAVVPLRQTATPAQRAALLARSDIADASSGANVAHDAVAYLNQLPYLRAADRAQLARITTFATPLREHAARALASRLERDADYVALADEATPELASTRLGCIVHQPEYPGVDLAALCLARH